MLGVLLGKRERDRILQAGVLIDGVQITSPSEPLGERVGGILSPRLAEARQPRDVMAVCLHVYGASCCDSAVAHVVVTNRTRKHLDDMADVVGTPSGPGEHTAEHERAFVA